MARRPYGYQCEKCGRIALSEVACNRAQWQSCPGHPIERLAREDLACSVFTRGHALWRNGPVIWCSRCAHYSRKMVRELANDCPRRVTSKHRLANLAAGRSPTGRITGLVVATPERLSVADWLDWREEQQGRGSPVHERPVNEVISLIEQDVIAIDKDGESDALTQS